MLAGICHKEFYKQRDQEVHPPLSRFLLQGQCLLTVLDVRGYLYSHTSFQLYHSLFPPSKYLKSIHNLPPVSTSPNPSMRPATISVENTAFATQELPSKSIPTDNAVVPTDAIQPQGVKLRSTRLYDFCDVHDCGECLDIVVVLIEYLRTGESKVGYPNRVWISRIRM